MAMEIPDRYQNRLSLTFVLDTQLIDNESPEMVELRQLREAGWIDLTRTDTMDTELSQRQDPDHRAELLGLSAPLVEHLGPMVWDHSRWDACVLGSDEEAAEWDRLWAVMFPGRDRAKASKNDIRDAMHVSTAMRYGASAFVTLDRRLLKRAPAVRAAFNDFPIMVPAQALDFARRMKAREEYRKRHPRP